MKLIHQNPECRDIAIWYDEFLIPGESFKDNIDKMLQSSKLFTLLVTPSLLKAPDGEPEGRRGIHPDRAGGAERIAAADVPGERPDRRQHRPGGMRAADQPAEGADDCDRG